MKNGGPAFPIVGTTEEVNVNEGMSLRDYFAAAALSGGLEQGVEDDMSGVNPDRDAWWHPPGKIARRAYAIADAMLVQKTKKP